MIILPKLILILKRKNMKNLILLFILSFSFNLFSQKPKLEIKIIEGVNTVLLINQQSNRIDTFVRIWSNAKLIDTLLNDSIVSFILETPRDYMYMKYKRINSKWIYSKTSGTLSDNPNEIKSMPTPELLERRKKKREFKIIGDDKVYMKIGDRETIIDCNDFKVKREAREREYQEWLIKEEAKKQEKK